MDYSKVKFFKFMYQGSLVSNFVEVELKKAKFGTWDLVIKESKRPIIGNRGDFIKKTISDKQVQEFLDKVKLIDFDVWNEWLATRESSMLDGVRWGLTISNGMVLTKNKIEVAGSGASFPLYFDWFCSLLVDLGATSLKGSQFERNPYWEPHLY